MKTTNNKQQTTLNFGNFCIVGDHFEKFAKALISFAIVLHKRGMKPWTLFDFFHALEESAAKNNVKIPDGVIANFNITGILSGAITEVTGEFNGINITASKNSTIESLTADFDLQAKKASEAYENSSAGKKAKADKEQKLKAAQTEAKELMKQLPKLNFKSNLEVIGWLYKIQPFTDYIGAMSSDQKNEIISTLTNNGFLSGVNTGKDFKKDDEDNFARYVIGQALSGLTGMVGAIHHMVGQFAKEWKEKFHKKGTPA
jgi:hypothetical protein